MFYRNPIMYDGANVGLHGETKKPMLGKFGIGFKRDMLIEDYGARPVIYCDFLDKFDIGEDSNWLYEELDIQKHDFQWLRE